MSMMNSMTMIDLARTTAADVIVQWAGVNIDWSAVRDELDRHWFHEDVQSRGENWTGHDENEFRNLVVRELERAHVVRCARAK